MRKSAFLAAAGLVVLLTHARSDASHQGTRSPCCASVFCVQSDTDPQCDNPDGGWACGEIAVGDDPLGAGCIEPVPDNDTCAGGNPLTVTGCVCADPPVPGFFTQCAAQGGDDCTRAAVRGCREAGTAHCMNCATPPCSPSLCAP